MQISSNQTVNETNDVSVSCKATGTPPPNITWTKDGNKDKILNSSSIFSLKNISREQHGLYWCIADNGLNKAFASASIIVQCACKHCLCYLKGSVLVQISEEKSRRFTNKTRSTEITETIFVSYQKIR